MPNHIDDTGERSACPDWCCSSHSPTLHVDDRHHHSRPRRVVVITGAPTLEPDDDAHPAAVIARLVRRVDSDLTWLEVLAEEGRDVRLVLTIDSGRRLLAVLHTLADECGGRPQPV
jgi:hypothetical protein